MLVEVSDAIKSAGALSAIHCCGKCDWKVPIQSGVNMLNLDAYGYAQNLSVYSREVEKFLFSGGKIVCGVVPTLDKEALIEALGEPDEISERGYYVYNMKTTDTKFKDVSSSSFAYDAIRWAESKGINFGTNETTLLK